MNTVLMVVILAAALRETCGVIIMAQQEMTAKLIRSKCQPETGASTEAIEGVLEGKFPDDRNLKCYMKCAMIMSLTMRDGKLRTDVALSVAEKLAQGTKDRVIAAIQKCSNADAGLTDPCDIAFAATKCVHDADSEETERLRKEDINTHFAVPVNGSLEAKSRSVEDFYLVTSRTV